jgi:hypothetical protein
MADDMTHLHYYASSLLEVIISNVPIGKNDKDKKAMVSFTDLEESGRLLRTLLTSIRHRGAFSAVYPTYVSLCARLLSSQDPELNSLPRQWIEVRKKKCKACPLTLSISKTCLVLHQVTSPSPDEVPVFRFVS